VTLEHLVEQLRRRWLELGPHVYVEQSPPAEVRLVRADDLEARRPGYDDRDAPMLAPGGDWREPPDTTVWLRFRLSRPSHWPVEHTALVAQRFGTLPIEAPVRVGLALQRMQGMLYLDGRPYHGLDQYHRLVYLPAGPEYELAASVWTGLVEFEWQPNPVFRLVRVDPDAEGLSHDLQVLGDALAALAPDAAARPALERIAGAALAAVDWRSPGGAAFRESVRRAHRLVEAELAAPRPAEDGPSIVAVGHAHIDCAWLWPLSQTREKAGRTWSTALRLMERYPDYHFLASTPYQYELVKQHFPETFDGIRRRVRDGRWEPVGGMWVEADCNLPDGESLARQLLVGTRYFEREFDVQTRVVWLPDSFGFSWALPTLLAAAGLPYFVTHKLSWSQTNRIPHDTFRWRGPDGSDVLAHFLCTPSPREPARTTYSGTLLPSEALGAWRRYQDRSLHDQLLLAFGHGDGGGGPTIDMIESGRRLAALPGFPRVRPGTARAFFERLEHELRDNPDVPVWDGELYLEYHRGTYTGQARQKLRNALSQRLYHAAELYASAARAWLGAAYPRTALDEGWRLLLTNQFHDILPGSAISAVYRDAEADFRRLAELGQAALDDALGSLAGAIDLPGPSLVVFNPSPYPSADYLELPRDVQPLDASGRPLPSQPTASGERLVFVEGVPAHGYQAFALSGTPAEEHGAPRPSATDEVLESPFWRLELDPNTGRIARLLDRRRGQDVLPVGRVGNRLVVFEDRPLDFDAWDIDSFHVAKPYEVDALESSRVLESGPERSVLELRWRFGERTRVAQRLCLYARSPRIDFVTEVDWHERQALLKVAFPTTIRSRRATYEIQFGAIERPTHRNTSWEEAAFEVPAQRWADLSDAGHGVALLADCKHGYSVQQDTLWLSLLKGAIDPDPEADLGQHRFTYSLLPHAGAGLHEVRRAAYGLTRPPLWRREPAHAGVLPGRLGLAQVDAPGVLVETLKWAEDEDALVVRLYEADGGATGARLRLGFRPAAVDRVDLLERHPRPLPLVDDDAVRLELRAHEVTTLLVRPARAASPTARR
jgi:alpha-mannosidase